MPTAGGGGQAVPGPDRGPLPEVRAHGHISGLLHRLRLRLPRYDAAAPLGPVHTVPNANERQNKLGKT